MSDVKKQDGDGMKSKESGGMKSIGCPAENKVIKSPVKKEAADAKSSEEFIPYCPCNDYLEEELSTECESCHKYWHLCCDGLRGLTEDMVSSLENWECPDCYKCIYSYKKKTEVSADCNSMRVILKHELHLIQPVIRVTVENAIRKLVPKSICSTDDVKEAVKSYAEVTKENQRKVIEEATLAKSSKNVVESVVRQLDADKIERERRKLNVVILNVPEPPETVSIGQKKKLDTDFCRETLGMESGDFDSCWRVGKNDTMKKDYCRPLIIQMADMETVNEWTRDGRGLQTESGHWINNDLCAADRRANFLAREERRKRLKSRS